MLMLGKLPTLLWVAASIVLIGSVVGCSGSEYGVTNFDDSAEDMVEIDFRGPPGGYLVVGFELDCPGGQPIPPHEFSMNRLGWQKAGPDFLNQLQGDLVLSLRFRSPSTSVEECVLRYEGKAYRMPKK